MGSCRTRCDYTAAGERAAAELRRSCDGQICVGCGAGDAMVAAGERAATELRRSWGRGGRRR